MNRTLETPRSFLSESTPEFVVISSELVELNITEIMHMTLHNKLVTSNNLMNIILEEYNRHMLQDSRKKKSSDGEDTAFEADASSKKGKWKGKHFGGDCNNCSLPGHKEYDC